MIIKANARNTYKWLIQGQIGATEVHIFKLEEILRGLEILVIVNVICPTSLPNQRVPEFIKPVTHPMRVMQRLVWVSFAFKDTEAQHEQVHFAWIAQRLKASQTDFYAATGSNKWMAASNVRLHICNLTLHVRIYLHVENEGLSQHVFT